MQAVRQGVAPSQARRPHLSDVQVTPLEYEEGVMIVVGLDPGYEHSALVTWDTTMREVVGHVDISNDSILTEFRAGNFIPGSILVIEQIESMGMAVGKTTFETVYWSGRFAEAFHPERVERVTRREVKLHLCGQARANDGNIRQALIDRFGPSTEQAIGKKAKPGPLYGVTGHKLSALAVALTWADQNSEGLL